MRRSGLAGRLRLSRLTVLWDDNHITIDGDVALSETGDQLARFKAEGWAVKRIDGHDFGQIRAALRWARRQDRPTLIACRTRIGKGAATLEGHHDAHGKALGARRSPPPARSWCGRTSPSSSPSPWPRPWRAAGAKGGRGAPAMGQAAEGPPTTARRSSGPWSATNCRPRPSTLWTPTWRRWSRPTPANATRVHSGAALEVLIPAIPEMIGGSADLTGSNNTFVKGMQAFDHPDYAGRYVHYGVREFGMAAAMNGMALHGGVIPYSGTFLVFSDYARPALRLAALMGVRAIHVMTHDSSAWARTGRRTSRSNTWPPCAPCPTCWSSAPPTRWRRPNAGAWRWRRRSRHRSWPCRGKRSRPCG